MFTGEHTSVPCSPVCAGGFTKEASHEADRADVPIRLLDLDPFARTYVEVYDKVNDNDRAILPLTRIRMSAQRTAFASVNNCVKR